MGLAMVGLDTPMSTNGGDRLISGAEFRKRREAVCEHMNEFAIIAGAKVRTLSDYELGITKKPRDYEKLISTLERFERGEITPETPIPRGSGAVEVYELGNGITATLRAEDYANLGEWLRAQEGMERLARGFRGER